MLITWYKQIRVEHFQKVYFMVDIEREIEKAFQQFQKKRPSSSPLLGLKKKKKNLKIIE